MSDTPITNPFDTMEWGNAKDAPLTPVAAPEGPPTVKWEECGGCGRYYDPTGPHACPTQREEASRDTQEELDDDEAADMLDACAELLTNTVAAPGGASPHGSD
jgi:hypothetical protein